MIDFIKQKLLSPKLSQKAIKMYFYQLPDSVRVEWFRDDRFIVGKVETDKETIVTQGLNAEDFVDMVNDALMTMLDIPLYDYRVYVVSDREHQKLCDPTVSHSKTIFSKNSQILTSI